MNELALFLSLFLIFGATVLSYRLFGKSGLFAFIVIATILANIEVLIIIKAFGIEQTLGNVMFASTYLATDIISENEGKKAATKAVYIGIFASISMLIFTQVWFLFTPSSSDWAAPLIKQIFAVTPRLTIASFIGYAVSQRLDVFLYHKWWEYTTKKFGDKKRFLWVRNNFSTLISQIVNTIIFNLLAFYGFYDTKTLISIIISSYLIYVATSVLDTPFVYLARHIKAKHSEI